MLIGWINLKKGTGNRISLKSTFNKLIQGQGILSFLTMMV